MIELKQSFEIQFLNNNWGIFIAKSFYYILI